MATHSNKKRFESQGPPVFKDEPIDYNYRMDSASILLLASGVLHWLVSQSLFLARVSVFDENGNEDTTGSSSTVGYSNIAVVTVIAFGGILLITSQYPRLQAIQHGSTTCRDMQCRDQCCVSPTGKRRG